MNVRADPGENRRNTLELRHRIAIYERLRDELSPRDEDNCVSWLRSGTSDAKIASDLTGEFGRLVTASNVAAIRSQMFGQIRTPQPTEPADVALLVALLTGRVSFLEAEVSRLNEALGPLIGP